MKDIAPEVWKILVKQVYVDALSYGIWFVIGLVSCFYLYKLGIHAKKESEEDSYSSWEFIAVFAFILSPTSGVLSIVFLNSCITRILNPEFYAIQYILSQF